MSDLSFKELAEELDFSFFLDTEGIDYKETFGSSGDQYNIKNCPACGNNKWKVYVGVESGLGNCFRCEERFNKLTFIKEFYALPDWVAVRFKCQELLRDQGWRPKRKRAKTVIETPDVVLPLSTPLPFEDGLTLQYLADRGVTNELAEYFELRYSQNGLWVYRDHEGKKQAQKFFERLIIPVFDLDGTLRTFQGRDLLGVSDRKYLFPISLPGTGKFLLNGQNAIAAAHIVLAEGAFDVMAVKRAFDQDVTLSHVVPVGTFGKHLSYGNQECDDQIGRLIALRKQGLQTATIMWDGEVSALEAALKAAAIVRGIGIDTRVALLPAGKDPAEITSAEVIQAFQQAVTWNPMVDVKLKMRNPYRA